MATARQAPLAPSDPPVEDVRDITRRFLMYVVLPVWLAAGIADWICHRRSSIEATTGPKESLMHLLMLAEASVPVLCGMFLEVTSPVLALMMVSVLLHDATALWDVSYAVGRREVTPVEQHVHSFLEMVPAAAAACISILHWPQVLALFGISGKRPDLGPAPQTAAATLALLRQECWRCRCSSSGCLISKSCCGRQSAHALQNWQLTVTIKMLIACYYSGPLSARRRRRLRAPPISIVQQIARALADAGARGLGSGGARRRGITRVAGSLPIRNPSSAVREGRSCRRPRGTTSDREPLLYVRARFSGFTFLFDEAEPSHQERHREPLHEYRKGDHGKRRDDDVIALRHSIGQRQRQHEPKRTPQPPQKRRC
jgi:hypothetical protein